MDKPNLLFIMTDQFRWDALGTTGGWAKTPNLDRLAGEGMLFSQCITNSPVCIPARVSLATGLYPHQTQVWGNEAFNLPPDSRTWMQAIRDEGYRTCLVGKSHLHRHTGDLRDREPYMNAYGFDVVDEIGGPRASMHVGSRMTDEWKKAGVMDAYIQDYKERYAVKPYMARPSILPLELYADVYVGSRAAAFITECPDDKPWFCMASFGGPHEPWDSPEPYGSMYDPAAMPTPISRPPVKADRPLGFLDKLMADPEYSPAMTGHDIAAIRANYAGNVTLIDEQIGRLLEALKKRGMLENTAIVFTSDHGEMNGDYGLIYKENFLASAVRVPLLIWTPELKRSGRAGTVCDEMVELFDVGATLCELAGTAPRYRQSAKSLVPILGGRAKAHRDYAISEIHGEVMIQNREWKLALNAGLEPYLLFNLREDRNERHNLVSEPASIETIRLLRAAITGASPNNNGSRE